MIPSRDEQQRLIDRVSQDSRFARPERNSRALAWLAEHSDDKEERKAGLERFLDAAGVRSVSISVEANRLQQRLDEFFDGPGKNERWRIHIVRQGDGTGRRPVDLYSLIYKDNVACSLSAIAFWQPHLDNRPVLSYGEPLFWTDREHHIFLRDVRFNREDDLKHKHVGGAAVDCTPLIRRLHMSVCSTFVTFGEALCMLRLTRWFAMKGIAVDVYGHNSNDSARSLFKQSSAHASAIILGATRVNGVLRDYQNTKSPFQFFLGDSGIKKKGTSKIFLERTDRRGDITIAYALLSRRKGIEHSVITMISSNNGRAIEGIGDLLTDEAEMSRLTAHACFGQQYWPEEFQLLFEIEIVDRGALVGQRLLVDTWPKKHPETLLVP